MLEPKDKLLDGLIKEDVEGQKGSVELGVTRTRWWILFVFAFMTFMQGLNWAIPGPISDSTQALYGWSAGVTALLLNWGPIFFIPLSLPLAFLIDSNFRTATIVAAVLVALGGWMRVLGSLAPPRSLTTLALMHCSQIFNAASGPVAMGAVARLSQLWFAANERAVATAVGAVMNMVGVAMAFVIGPKMFPTGNLQQANLLWWTLAITSTLPLACAIVYYPAKPARPPSHSAHIQRTTSIRHVGHGAQDRLLETEEEKEADEEHAGFLGRLGESWIMLQKLLQNRQFLILAAGYGGATGIYSGWATLLASSLRNVDMGQTEAGWIGFTSTIGGCAAGLVSGFAIDHFKKSRPLLIGLMGFSAAAFLAFTIIFEVRNAAEPQSWFRGSGGSAMLFALASIGGFMLNATIPAFYESAAESAYPLDQGFIATMLANANNIACLLFLGVGSIPNIGTRWENWTMFACCLAIVITFLTVYKEVQNRRAIDESDDESDGESSELRTIQ